MWPFLHYCMQCVHVIQLFILLVCKTLVVTQIHYVCCFMYTGRRHSPQQARADRETGVKYCAQMPDHNHTPKSFRLWVDGQWVATRPIGATTAPGPALESTCVFAWGRKRKESARGWDGFCPWSHASVFWIPAQIHIPSSIFHGPGAPHSHTPYKRDLDYVLRSRVYFNCECNVCV